MPVVRAAEVHAVLTSATACDVTINLTVEGTAEPIDHRLDALSFERIAIDGAQQVGVVRAIGRTHSLVLQPERGTYVLRYHAEQSPSLGGRCPLWLPAIPTDGVSPSVNLAVDLPVGASPGSSMPAFSWAGTHGTATLGHLPAFVHVPFATAGAAPPLGMATVVDTTAVLLLIVGSALWVWRRKR